MKKRIFMFLQLIILLFLAYEAYSHGKSTVMVSPDISQWESRYTAYDGNGWKISSENPEDAGSEEIIDLIYGPFLTLPRGSYCITINYETNEMQEYEVYSFNNPEGIIHHDNEIIDSGRNSVTHHFTLLKNIFDLEVRVRYRGKGSLNINNIQISTSNYAYLVTFLVALLLFLIIDLWMISVSNGCGNETSEIAVWRGIAFMILLFSLFDSPIKRFLSGFALPLILMILFCEFKRCKAAQGLRHFIEKIGTIKEARWYDKLGTLIVLFVCGCQVIWINNNLPVSNLYLMIIGALLMMFFAVVCLVVICDKINIGLLSPLAMSWPRTVIFCAVVTACALIPYKQDIPWYLMYLSGFAAVLIIGLLLNIIKNKGVHGATE